MKNDKEKKIIKKRIKNLKKSLNNIKQIEIKNFFLIDIIFL